MDADRAVRISREIFLWASLIYTSRAFPDSLLRVDGKQVDSRKLMTEVNEVDPGARPCLIPLLDMLNHRPYEKVVWMKGQSALSLISVEETKAGNELFNNYGPKSNAECNTHNHCLTSNFDLLTLGSNCGIWLRHQRQSV